MNETGPSELSLWPTAASAYAVEVDWVIFAFTAVILLLTVPIFTTLVSFAFRYHYSNQNIDRSNPVERNAKLELTWIVIPFVVTMGFFVWAGVLFYRLNQVPDGALQVNAVGRQWMWKFQHPGGQSEINDLHVPVRQPVRITMISEDVIHALYVPALRIKVDVLPGRYRDLWFEADTPGTYRLLCTEFCGTDHSHMGGYIYIMEPAEYEAWLDRSTTDLSLAAAGKNLFRSYGCTGCHGAQSAQRAPTLNNLYGHVVPLEGGHTLIADERYIRDSIVLPKSEVVAGYKPIMPSYAGQIPEEDLLKLVAYVKRLGESPEWNP